MKPKIPNSLKAEELFKNLKDLLEELDKKGSKSNKPKDGDKEKQNETKLPK